MGTTPKYAWPYPELTDPPDGAGQIRGLATAIENTVSGGQPSFRSQNTTAQPLTATWTKYVAGAATVTTAAHIVVGGASDGAISIDVAGLYLITCRCDFITKEAAGASASAGISFNTPAGNIFVNARGSANNTFSVVGTDLYRFAIGDVSTAYIAGAGLGVSPIGQGLTVTMTRISP